MILRLITLVAILIPPTLLVWCGGVWFTDDFYLDRIVTVCRISGYGTLGLLAATLFLTPLVRVGSLFGFVVQRENVVAVSKRLGLASGMMAIAHGAIAISSYLEFDLTVTIYSAFLRSGVLAFGILVLLMVTSSQRLTRVIRFDLWKPLQRLIYVAALLVAHHMLLSPFAPRRLTLILFAVGFAVMSLRFLPSRTPPAAQGSIETQSP